jgi:hypothetical protein
MDPANAPQAGIYMDLSPAALAYLATLQRMPAVPVEQVADALQRANCLMFQTWLDF